MSEFELSVERQAIERGWSYGVHDDTRKRSCVVSCRYGVLVQSSNDPDWLQLRYTGKRHRLFMKRARRVGAAMFYQMPGYVVTTIPAEQLGWAVRHLQPLGDEHAAEFDSSGPQGPLQTDMAKDTTPNTT